MEDTKILPLRKVDIKNIQDWLKELLGRTVYVLDKNELTLSPLEVSSARVFFNSGFNQFNVIEQEIDITVYSNNSGRFYYLNKEAFLYKEDAVNYISNKLLT